MAIKWSKVGVSAGVGLVDEGLDYWTSKNPAAAAKPFQNPTDLGRLVVALGGLGLAQFTRYQDMGEAIGLPGVAFLTKSVVSAVKTMTSRTTAGSFVARRVAWGGPPGMTQAQSRVAQTTYGPFEGERTY